MPQSAQNEDGHAGAQHTPQNYGTCSKAVTREGLRSVRMQMLYQY